MTEQRTIIAGHAFVLEGGSVTRPSCCGGKMLDDGDCGHGCCDDYCCLLCGRRVRVEWPD